MLYESTKRYFCGIFKRVWLWVPAFLLDPWDIFNRFINPNLPESFRREEQLNLPSELFPWALGGLVFWAGLLTYHELRKKHVEFKFASDQELQETRSAIQEKQNKQSMIDRLAKFRHFGNVELFNRRVATEDEWSRLKNDHKTWWDEVVTHLEENFTEAEVLKFKSLGSLMAADYPPNFNSEHNALKGQIDKRLKILQEIIDRS